jgi:hypothetical protein
MMLLPLTIAEANEFVRSFHRHSRPVLSARYAIGLESDGELCGCAIVGRPVARMLQNGTTAEVTRLCVNERAPRCACSRVYRACWRAWVAMGGRRLVTYTLKSETGASLRGAGFKLVGEVRAEEWSRVTRRREWQPVYGQQKFRWELAV